MKRHPEGTNITGKLIQIDEEHLTLEPGHIVSGIWFHSEPIIYPHKGLDIKASNWVERFLNTRVKCKVVDNVVTAISQLGGPTT